MTTKITPMGDPEKGKYTLSYRKWRWGKWHTIMYDKGKPFLFTKSRAEFFQWLMSQI